MADLLNDLPQNLRPAFERYLTLGPTNKSQLLEDVESYLETISLVASENELFDLELGQAVGRGLRDLVQRCKDDDLSLVQAATRYFIEDEDSNPDLITALGFEDDATVYNCVCDFLGYGDLKVSF